MAHLSPLWFDELIASFDELIASSQAQDEERVADGNIADAPMHTLIPGCPRRKRDYEQLRFSQNDVRQNYRVLRQNYRVSRAHPAKLLRLADPADCEPDGNIVKHPAIEDIPLAKPCEKATPVKASPVGKLVLPKARSDGLVSKAASRVKSMCTPTAVSTARSSMDAPMHDPRLSCASSNATWLGDPYPNAPKGMKRPFWWDGP